MHYRSVHLFFAILFSLTLPIPTSAVMTSTNYYIYADTIDTGGILSTSSAYRIQDTIGETSASFTTSSSYIIHGGFQGSEQGSLSLTFSASAVGLGSLTTGAVASGSSIATITTDSATGYSLSIGSVSGSSLASVSDGTVTAGVEEYGVAVSGTDSAFVTDQGVTAGLVLASFNAPVNNSQTTLTFKAAISGASSAGAYSQTVTIAASANL